MSFQAAEGSNRRTKGLPQIKVGESEGGLKLALGRQGSTWEPGAKGTEGAEDLLPSLPERTGSRGNPEDTDVASDGWRELVPASRE